MDEAINIVLATDESYAQHAAVVMASVLANTETPDKIRFYVIADAVRAEKQKKLEDTVARWGSKVQFASLQNEAFKQAYVSGYLSRAAYFRLDIPTVLPEEVRKAIYLDCDLIVLQDIRALWDIDLGGFPLGAVEDLGVLASANKKRNKQEVFGWEEKYSYFNSGVLLLDLDLWRKEDYTNTLLELLAKKHYRHHDQDALNELFMGKWQKLPLRWNVIPPVWHMNLLIIQQRKYRQQAKQAVRDRAILHYAGGYKPWEYKEYAGFNDVYYRYLAQTPFRDAPMPQISERKNREHSICRELFRLRWGRWIRELL